MHLTSLNVSASARPLSLASIESILTFHNSLALLFLCLLFGMPFSFLSSAALYLDLKTKHYLF